MVCGQIAEDFSELRTLCVANVFNTSIKKPNVFELEHLYTKEYQKDLEQADVIVATPSCALSLSESDWAKENIDLVEVDDERVIIRTKLEKPSKIKGLALI